MVILTDMVIMITIIMGQGVVMVTMIMDITTMGMTRNLMDIPMNHMHITTTDMITITMSKNLT